jgi:poly(3-hydroxybutyrate) depolymerase
MAGQMRVPRFAVVWASCGTAGAGVRPDWQEVAIVRQGPFCGSQRKGDVMITKLGLSLALFTLAGLLSGPADACSNPINPTLSRSTIHTADFHRQFIVAGCADDVPPDGLPIVFGFHGGGEALHNGSGSGFLDFTNLSALHALVIAPVGNVSNNGHSWINAFPWMKPHPENDLDLPAALIDWIATRPELPRADLSRVYALGKSDGAGMSMALACHRDPRVNLVGVALVSGAYFGLASATNFGREDHEICLPEFPVRMMMMHGTGDQVMPYPGQNFLNPKALEHADDYWTSIDPTARLGAGWLSNFSRTYTADIARYVATLSNRVFHCTGFDESSLGSASTLAVGTGCDAPFHVITVRGGNHVWPGHAMSGPDSGRYPNMDFDATAEIARFFSIPMSVGSTHDFNGDGTSDIAWRNTNGNAAIWLMTVDPSGTAQILSSADYGIVDNSWQIVGQRDFNADGKADLLWSNSNGDTSIWLMNGTQVAAATDLGLVGNGWSIVGTGDFNGDGFGDILWRNTNGDTSIWLMTGTATQVQVLSTTDLGGVATTWSIVGTGDFNGDGFGDILWRNTNGDTSIWLMTANGTQVQVLSTNSLGFTPTSWTIVGTGDFNGDGKSDILWHNTNGDTSIWLMTANGTQMQVLSTTDFGLIPTSWNVAVTGDFNGDGKSDILWRNANGDTLIWFMTPNGTQMQVLSVTDLGSVPPSWVVQGAGAD